MKGIKWFFAEFLVVVTGVLVAFALNSWWVDLKDSKKEEVYLKQVLEDINSSIDLLDNAKDFERRAAYATANLLKVNYSNTIPADSSLNQYAISSMSFEPGGLVQSTLLSLISSGDLQLIGSDSIRMELTFLSGALQEYETQRKRITSDMLFPGFKDLSGVISPFDLSFYSISDDQYSLAAADSLVPLPERENFKRPELMNWKKLMSQKEFQEKLSFMYFAHINLLRLHSRAHANLMESKNRIESFMVSE